MVFLENRRALHEYEVLERFEAGMVLHGWEAKSIRARTANMRAAWVKIKNGEVLLENFQISPWKYSSLEQPKNREKKLLLTKKEIHRLESKLNEKGLSVVPLKIYQKSRTLKCEIALVRGKKKHEKRQVLKNRAAEKEARKTLKEFNNKI